MTRLSLILILLLVTCVAMPVGIVMAQEDAADAPSVDDAADAGMEAGADDAQDVEVVAGDATLKVRIVDTSVDQNPIKEAQVVILDVKNEDHGGLTDENGDYIKTGLAEGRYTISVYKEGYHEREGKTKVLGKDSEASETIKMRKKDNIISFFRKFGFVFYPLAICSIVALTFIIERLFTFVRSRSRIGTEQFIASIADSLRKENIMEAVSTCEEAGGPLANVLKAGLLRYSQAQIEERDITKEEIQEAIEEASLLEIPELERNLPVLGTVAVVSPLFGLLGTVTGMINAFTTIALEGTGDPQQLAEGISQALLTTAGGLTIAIPCLIFFQLFDSWVNRHMVEISQVSTEIINQLIVGEANA